MADPKSVPAARSGARYAIVVLTAMNLLNYIDRYVPSAVKPLFQQELGFTDAQTAYPLTAFVLVYMLTSPIFGSLADRMSRKALIAPRSISTRPVSPRDPAPTATVMPAATAGPKLFSAA